MSSLERYSTDHVRRLICSLNSIQFKDATGEVEYFGQKVVMMRRDAFTLIRDALTRALGGASQIILGIAGHTVGKEEGKALLKTKGARLPDFIQFAVEETNLGYGKVKIDDLDIESGTVSISLSNSFEAEQHIHTLNPTCAFTLGYLKGIFSALVGKDFEGKETECKSKGDPVCKFNLVTRPKTQESFD